MVMFRRVIRRYHTNPRPLTQHPLPFAVQAKYRAFSQQKKYQQLRAAAIIAQKFARVVLARIRARKTKQAIQTIRAFIKGFTLRNQPACKDNEL